MSQCMLGKTFDNKPTDVDSFCLLGNPARIVRSWLVKAAGQLCTGFNDPTLELRILGVLLGQHRNYEPKALKDSS